jgi:hypothetical protein
MIEQLTSFLKTIKNDGFPLSHLAQSFPSAVSDLIVFSEVLDNRCEISVIITFRNGKFSHA